MPTAISSTIVKAFEVLELFQSHSLLGAGDCARMLGMPRASAHRMLVSLRQAGALETTPRGQYRLTLRMFELGLRVPQQRWLYDAAYLPMEELAGRTKLSVHLAVRDGFELVYVAKLRHAVDRTRARAGERNCLHATALGKVLLAYSPAEAVAALTRRGLRRHTPHTITTPGLLYEQLVRIREEGVGFDHEERAIGLVSLAVPICARRGVVVAALSVLAPAERYGLRLDRLGPDVVAARRQIERNLRPVGT